MGPADDATMKTKPSDWPRTGLVADPRYEAHDPGPRHPEAPARLQAVRRGVAAAVPAERLLALPPRAATPGELQRVHAAAYIANVHEDVTGGAPSLRTGDTDICAASFDTACLAVGGALAAVDAVMAGTVRNAFCAVRPPGHHAGPERGMGFCIFNNIALAARHVQARHGVERVLIVDWDVHHGNGTQDTFYRDPTVFYFSTHQWPLYPGTGAAAQTGDGPGRGTTLNCPFARGATGTDIVGAFRDKLVPAMRSFRPDFVLISAGFDSRQGDPLGGFALTDADFTTLTRIMRELAHTYARDRLVSVLEGGYNLDGLATAAGAHVRALSADA